MTDPVLHDHLPKAPWLDPAVWRLPGVQPLAPQDWLIRDEAFAGQMALRDRLIAERPRDVHDIMPTATEAALECLDLTLQHLKMDTGYQIEGDRVRRPDGVSITIDRAAPLVTIGKLQQADVCLLEASPQGHVLTGAILCFPAQWTLAEKMGHPLGRIHVPVETYTPEIEMRVQRLFDAIRPGQVLWRANAFLYDTPTLYAPKTEREKMSRGCKGVGDFVRSERQTLRRLPKRNAVVFTIHTYMMPTDRLSSEQRSTLDLLV